MTTNAELIARLQAADAEELMTTSIVEEAAEAIEALESKELQWQGMADKAKGLIDELLIQRTVLQAERDSLAHQLNRQKQWKDAMRDKMQTLRYELDAVPAIKAERDALQAQLTLRQNQFERAIDQRDALQAQLAAAQGQEPLHWVVPYYGFTFPTQEAAQRHQDNLECVDKPIACYAAAIPQQVAEPAKVYTTCGNCDGLGKVLIYGIEESWEETCPKCNGGPAAPQPKDTK